MDIALNTPASPTANRPAKPRPRSTKRSVPMVVKLAYRNLFHDRLSFAVTIVGIVFSVVLVAVQTGIYLGSEKKIASIIDAAPADLWIVPLGTKSYDDPSLLSGRERHMALSTPGVEIRRRHGCFVCQVAQAGRRPDHDSARRLGTGERRAAAVEYRGGQPRRDESAPTRLQSTRAISPISASRPSTITAKSTASTSRSQRPPSASARSRRCRSCSRRSRTPAA